MRTIAPAALAALARGSIVQLIELDTTVPIFVTTASVDIDWSGHTYIGRRAVGADSIKDQGGEIIGLRFSLSGVNLDTLAIALAEPVQGKAIRVRTAILDPDTHAILDVSLSWAGTMDQMPIQQTPATAVIGVTAEHRGIAFSRPKGLRYTDADQQYLFPGDKCLEFIASQSQHQDVWPAASFFRQ